MLRRALEDDYWDVMMVGFNLLNPSARRYVFPHAIEKNIGIEIMFAVRRALSDPDKLRIAIAELAQQGYLDGAIATTDPLGFLVESGAAKSIVEAAYRFTRHEPGSHVVLTGTGNIAHLEQNVHSLTRGPSHSQRSTVSTSSSASSRTSRATSQVATRKRCASRSQGR
jgi:aryl-alcohol dehydrogenase-like predicted oxidoreductase